VSRSAVTLATSVVDKGHEQRRLRHPLYDSSAAARAPTTRPSNPAEDLNTPASASPAAVNHPSPRVSLASATAPPRHESPKPPIYGRFTASSDRPRRPFRRAAPSPGGSTCSAARCCKHDPDVGGRYGSGDGSARRGSKQKSSRTSSTLLRLRSRPVRACRSWTPAFSTERACERRSHLPSLARTAGSPARARPLGFVSWSSAASKHARSDSSSVIGASDTAGPVEAATIRRTRAHAPGAMRSHPLRSPREPRERSADTYAICPTVVMLLGQGRRRGYIFDAQVVARSMNSAVVPRTSSRLVSLKTSWRAPG
jgi:hypothetical protein